MLIRDAELDYGRRRADLRIVAGRIEEIASGLIAADGESVFDAHGGAVLPGLHDHHLHLFAFAASLESLHCGPPHVRDEPSLARTLAGAAARDDGWIRGDGYHESVAGELDRDRLDALRDDVALRIQHRSGAMWFLNSRALQRLSAASAPPPSGLERDAGGRPTGRLFRADAWLRERLGPMRAPDLKGVGRRLAAFGITGCTDATAANSTAELTAFEVAERARTLPLDLLVMGTDSLPATPAERARNTAVSAGAVKVLLDDVALPQLDALANTIETAHGHRRNVAVHCVTRAQLFLALGAWEEAGVRAGDRIEHASVCPPEAARTIADLGLRVVTQPIFVRDRGDAYLEAVDRADLPWLYRCRGLLESGIALAAGSDAPYGDANPWRAMQAAVDRRTARGAKLGEKEALTAREAVELYTTSPQTPGSAPRRIEQRGVADLCILRTPWASVRGNLAAAAVVATIRAGDFTHGGPSAATTT